MQYTKAPYVITEEEDNRIRNRRETFIRETGTEKTVLITMITSYGLAPGGYSDDIQCQLTMADFECLQRLNMLNLQPLKRMGVCKDI